jgi:DNA-directed RNA polymerase subunit RPC12/RpoP
MADSVLTCSYCGSEYFEERQVRVVSLMNVPRDSLYVQHRIFTDITQYQYICANCGEDVMENL